MRRVGRLARPPGFERNTGSLAQRPGRPAHNLGSAMAAKNEVFLGLDVGGTYLKGARIDGSGQVLERMHEPVKKDSAEGLMAQMADAARRLENGQRAASIGVGLPGLIDGSTGRLQNAPNLPVLN